MRRLLLRRAATLVLGTITALAVLTVPAVGGEGPAGQPNVVLLHAGRHRVFDVRRLPQLGRDEQALGRDDVTERDGPAYRTMSGGESAPVGSGLADSSLAPAPSAASFEGMHFSESCGVTSCGDGHPPDTNGDVGPTYYVQSINTAVAIYDKSNGSRVAAFTFDALMSQGSLGDLCDTNNFGDPVVLYDTFHGHWVITDFAFILQADGSIASPPGSFQCFAVSKTNNPVTGGWNFYSMGVSDMLQDYPKFGIWPDGLYMSANMFGFAAGAKFANVRVWALPLDQMEAGDANAQAQSFDVPKVQGAAPFSLLPSNARLQTGAPPAGRPNLFTSLAFAGGLIDTSLVRVWKFHVDWTTPANSSFSTPTDSSTGSTWITPPATVPSKNGNDLDTLALRLMMQNQYTNIGGVESLWNVHTVGGSSSGQAAVRWYQVPVTGGTIGSALQASTWNPDAANRFMPSLAVDKTGDMAIGYSVSSSTLFPAIRYAGRLATDSPSTLSLTETSMVEGTGSQTGNCGGILCERWGDYSAMTLDVDGCTFWYTNEYYVASGLDHHTRIGSFAFPGCSTDTGPTISALSVHAGPTAGGQTVIITGTNFTGVNWVSFGSTAAASLTVDSASQITAVTPAHAAGTIHVRVNTAAGTSSATNADLYTFGSPPTISALSVHAGPTAGGQTVIITGTNFTGVNWVSFGSTAAASLTVDSASQITAVTPVHAAGTIHVRINTAAGTSSVTNADLYTFGSPPTISALSVHAGPTAGGQTVIITGTNFTGVNWVSFGSTAAASLTVDSASQITAVTPAHAAGTIHVRVNTAAGTSSATNADLYTFQ